MGQKTIWYRAVDDDEWRTHIVWFARLRTIAGVAIGDISLAAIVGYFVNGDLATIGLILAFGIATVGILTAARILGIRTSRTGSQMHNLCHEVRDFVGSIQKVAADGHPHEYRAEFNHFNHGVTERIAKFFRSLLSDRTINCAVRLASKDDSNIESFVTVGRSSEMEKGRKEAACPLPSDKGVALKLRTENRQGVLYVYDIQDAIERGWWHESPTDKYPDVKTLMIAPINGFTDGSPDKSMLGIIYVTSRRNGTFRKIHMNTMRAIADYLGTVYPQITGLFEPENING